MPNLFINLIINAFYISVWRRYASGTIGSLVELPCNTTSPLRNDNVKLVLWFRNDSAIPFYT